MKKTFFLTVILSGAITISINAQISKQDYTKAKAFYNTAVRLADTASQISALVQMLSANPNDTLVLKTLSHLYIAQQNPTSATSATYRYLKIRPNDIDILKVHGSALQMAQKYHEALAVYTELYLQTKDIYYKYLQALMEYELFRQVEALRTIEECINDSSAATNSMLVEYSNKPSQWVKIKAVILNLKGLVLMDMKEPNKAHKAFEDALQIAPDFYGVIENINHIRQ